MQVENVLADLIRIKSVNPPGDETGVAEYLKRLFDQYAIPNEVIEPAPGRGSFLAHLGEGEKSLLFLSHTDVVTATEGWSFDPFCGEIKDGFVYGRGALDCKGLVAAEACAMINLALENRLKGKLIFAATADEETLGPLGIKYLMDNYGPRIKADFAINEGGEAAVKVGNKTCHLIAVGEKAPVWTRVKTKGVSVHGAMSSLGDNAVVKMAEVIKALADYRPWVFLMPEVRSLVQTVAALTGVNGEIDESNLDALIARVDNKNLAAWLTSITRMTVSPNMVSGGTKTNIVPDSCQADVDVRILPGQSREYALEELKRIIPDIEMEVTKYTAPTISPPDSGPFRLICATLQELVGDDLILPGITAGTTDSRILREAGIPSYGISMVTLNQDAAFRRSIHGRDEKIDIASLKLKMQFLENLARNYLGFSQ